MPDPETPLTDDDMCEGCGGVPTVRVDGDAYCNACSLVWSLMRATKVLP